jgi:hypothetical protein
MMTTTTAATGGDDPLSCTSLDAALCLAALAVSTQYTLAVARLGLEASWGAVAPGVFWAGLFGAPLAAMAPAWLLGRFTPVNPVWPAIGIATPMIVWSVGLWGEPVTLLLIGGAAVASGALTILPARHGRRLRARSIRRRGLCPGCGYRLAGLVGDVCPECGRRGR